MKTLIVIRGTGNTGKTQSIVKVYNIFDALKKLDKSLGIEELKRLDHTKGDFQAVLMYRGKKIGIESIGDPGSEHKTRLGELADDNCYIIISASRTAGETYDSIHYTAKEYGYELVQVESRIFLKEDEKNEILYDIWNRQIAEGIIGLIDDLINRI
jgi:hypothetical protein